MEQPLPLQDLAQRTVPDLLDRSAAHFGVQRRFLTEVASGLELTYEAFLARVSGAAQVLARRFEPGDVVGILMSNSARYVVLRYALATAGLVEAALNGHHKGDLLCRMLEIAQPRGIIVETPFEENLRTCGFDLGAVQIVDQAALIALTDLTSSWEERPRPALGPGDACRILYTSGTTGGTKGAELSHANEVFCGARYAQRAGLGRADRWLYATPFFHIDAIIAVSSALHFGGGLALAPRFSASQFWAQAAAHRATAFIYVGFMLSVLMKGDKPPAGNSMRRAIGGGCSIALLEEFEARFGVQVLELYAMTECSAVTMNDPDARRIGSVGRPFEGIRIAVVDNFEMPLKPGAKGEILVAADAPWGLMTGYRNDPATTRQSMRNAWFHTGDLGSLDDDGYLYYHGRLKDVIRRRGENISAPELESIVLQHPGVRYCAAIAVAGELDDEEVLLYLELAPHATVDASSVAAFIAERAAPFMWPRYIRIVESLPLTETNRVVKSRLAREIDAKTWRRPD